MAHPVPAVGGAVRAGVHGEQQRPRVQGCHVATRGVWVLGGRRAALLRLPGCGGVPGERGAGGVVCEGASRVVGVFWEVKGGGVDVHFCRYPESVVM